MTQNGTELMVHVFPVCAQTPSSAPYQEEEAIGRGAPGGAGPQTPAERSCASGSFSVNIAEGMMSVCF